LLYTLRTFCRKYITVSVSIRNIVQRVVMGDFRSNAELSSRTEIYFIAVYNNSVLINVLIRCGVVVVLYFKVCRCKCVIVLPLMRGVVSPSCCSAAISWEVAMCYSWVLVYAELCLCASFSFTDGTVSNTSVDNMP